MGVFSFPAPAVQKGPPKEAERGRKFIHPIVRISTALFVFIALTTF
jgi:hypothetical protein